MKRRHFLFAALLVPHTARANKVNPAQKLVEAAESQIGITTRYDPAYVTLTYPDGDVPIAGGVCTDVVIRAYREGLDIDLQQLVHEDMRKNFSRYPKTWGLTQPDRNIDHRRVPNLQRYFMRKGALLPVSDRVEVYQSGDLVTMMLPGNLPHIGIVAGETATGSKRPLLIHNIGAGTQKEDLLFAYPHTGRFRFALG